MPFRYAITNRLVSLCAQLLWYIADVTQLNVSNTKA